jgi:DNA-binding PucR family transcriptional regulator
VSQTERDERFLRFSFSHTIAQKLYDEDRRYGSNNYDLLWTYLVCERNATQVAERLNMHRNTVLYHIHRIEERFDLDLSQHDARERMLADFKVRFLHTKREL